MSRYIARLLVATQAQKLRVPPATSKWSSHLTQWEQKQPHIQNKDVVVNMKRRPLIPLQQQTVQHHRYVARVGCSLKILRALDITARPMGKGKTAGQRRGCHLLGHLPAKTVERAIAIQAALSTIGRPIRLGTSAVDLVPSTSTPWPP